MAYNAPIGTPPLYGDALDDLLQGIVSGITGVAGKFVRPRWQPEPPEHPPHDTNWIAFGLASFEFDVFPSIIHDPNGNSGNGVNIIERDERFKLATSFYGPDGQGIASRFRDGLMVEENRWPLVDANIGVIEVQQIINLPALLKEKWVRRVDLSVMLRRRVAHTYAVPTLIQGSLIVNTIEVIDEITITPN